MSSAPILWIVKKLPEQVRILFYRSAPRGLRPTLYVKDDDARMSFLLGNYISMTNLSDEDAERIINMKLTPINISVHTTDPELRSKMLGNKRGGASLNIFISSLKTE